MADRAAHDDLEVMALGAVESHLAAFSELDSLFVLEVLGSQADTTKCSICHVFDLSTWS